MNFRGFAVGGCVHSSVSLAVPVKTPAATTQLSALSEYPRRTVHRCFQERIYQIFLLTHKVEESRRFINSV